MLKTESVTILQAAEKMNDALLACLEEKNILSNSVG